MLYTCTCVFINKTNSMRYYRRINPARSVEWRKKYARRKKLAWVRLVFFVKYSVRLVWNSQPPGNASIDRMPYILPQCLQLRFFVHNPFSFFSFFLFLFIKLRASVATAAAAQAALCKRIAHDRSGRSPGIVLIYRLVKCKTMLCSLSLSYRRTSIAWNFFRFLRRTKSQNIFSCRWFFSSRERSIPFDLGEPRKDKSSRGCSSMFRLFFFCRFFFLFIPVFFCFFF